MSEATKERPILFSGEMVRAILAGRKTMTRRVVKSPEFLGCPTGDCPHWDKEDCQVAMSDESPYGKRGDHLWVRETFATENPKRPGPIAYSADGVAGGIISGKLWYHGRVLEAEGYSTCFPEKGSPTLGISKYGGKWRPSIHMPRWASRITLEISSIRVERLQDISDRGPSNDCTAEGVFHTGNQLPSDWHERGFNSSEKCAFHDLWESINGAGSWDANPWVWVLEFKRIAP